MIINYNELELNQLLADFYKLTNIPVSLFDTDFNQLAYQPTTMPEFCRIIKSTKLGKKRCQMSDKNICQLCGEQLKPLLHRCHAGLMDIALPIIHNGIILGYLMFGQIDDVESKSNTFESTWANCQDLKIDKTLLQRAYNQLQHFELDTVMSAMRILQACTYYIWTSDLIAMEKNQLADKIDTFITNNLQEQLSVDLLCHTFNITKNRLYSICRNVFGETVNNYIQKKRIDVAKKLLLSVDEPIYNVSRMVGIDDYNYFIKIFKSKTGVTPKTYQKTHHLKVNNAGDN